MARKWYHITSHDIYICMSTYLLVWNRVCVVCLRSICVGFAWSFCDFIRATNGQWPPTSKYFFPNCYPLLVCPILILEKNSSSLLILSAKEGNYWYHSYNVFGMMRFLTGDWTRDLPHSKPALGYRGGGVFYWTPYIQT